MRAKVTKAFPGVEDGKIYPRDIAVGETVTGDLARAAVEAKWADEIDEVKEAAAAKKREAEDARAAEKTAQEAVAKRLANLEAIAKGARVDISKAQTAEEIEAALTAANVSIPG